MLRWWNCHMELHIGSQTQWNIHQLEKGDSQLCKGSLQRNGWSSGRAVLGDPIPVTPFQLCFTFVLNLHSACTIQLYRHLTRLKYTRHQYIVYEILHILAILYILVINPWNHAINHFISIYICIHTYLTSNCRIQFSVTTASPSPIKSRRTYDHGWDKNTHGYTETRHDRSKPWYLRDPWGWELFSLLVSKNPKEIEFAFFFLDFYIFLLKTKHIYRFKTLVTIKQFGNRFPWHHVLRLLPGYLTRLGKAKGGPTCWWLGTTKHSGKLKSVCEILWKLCILALFRFYWRHAWSMPSCSTNMKHDETPRQKHPW